jgi:hypothetical protein
MCLYVGAMAKGFAVRIAAERVKGAGMGGGRMDGDGRVASLSTRAIKLIPVRNQSHERGSAKTSLDNRLAPS